MKKSVIILILLLSLILFIIVLYFTTSKNRMNLNECYGNNIAEWVYTTGDLEYDTCVDKNNKILFKNYKNALKKIIETKGSTLEYIKSEINEDEINEKNYNKYKDYCLKQVNEESTYYKDCEFIIHFTEVFNNNFK